MSPKTTSQPHSIFLVKSTSYDSLHLLGMWVISALSVGEQVDILLSAAPLRAWVDGSFGEESSERSSGLSSESESASESSPDLGSKSTSEAHPKPRSKPHSEPLPESLESSAPPESPELSEPPKAALARAQAVKQLGLPSPKSLLLEAKELGGLRILSCSTEVLLAGLSEEELKGKVDEVVSLPSFWRESAGCRTVCV